MAAWALMSDVLKVNSIANSFWTYIWIYVNILKSQFYSSQKLFNKTSNLEIVHAEGNTHAAPET